mgnify:CR=1 FL=1
MDLSSSDPDALGGLDPIDLRRLAPNPVGSGSGRSFKVDPLA